MSNYNFTLIIPTHKRHKYLERSIAYFMNLEAHVIYCDSSETKYKGKVAKNIEYCHLPGNQFSEKILFVLDLVKTNYVALCADDDFIIHGALYAGVNFLTKNNSFKTLLGQNIAFHEHFDGQYYYGGKTTRFNEINSGPNTNCSMFFRNYQQILWGLYHKEVLKNTFQIVNNAHFNNDNFIELVLGGIACYSGGIKILNDVWSVRELSAQEHWGDKHKTISIEYLNDNNSDFNQFQIELDKITYKGFAKSILKNYLKLTKLSKYELALKNGIKNIFPVFLFNHNKFKLKRKNDNNSVEKYPSLKKYRISLKNENQLNEISSLIERFCE